MGAGSLSDARVVALLSKHFVNLRLPELSTEGLIAEPEDREWLRALDAESRRRGGTGFFGGEREAFLTEDGELLETILSLGRMYADNQHARAARQQPDWAVTRFFAAARRALERTPRAVPADFDDILAGRAPEVAQAAARAAPPPVVPEAQLVLRVMVRNDRLMYEGLGGQDLLAVPPALAEKLDPRQAEPGGRVEWPRDLFVELAHRSYPRGHVAPRLDDTSIHGSLTLLVESRQAGTIRGRIRGEFELRPTRREELGQRSEARVGFHCRAELSGDFSFDDASGRFTRLRIASSSSTLRHDDVFAMYGRESYQLGVELVRPASPRDRRGH